MSSMSRRGVRQELTEEQYDKLRDQLKNGNRAQRRRAEKLLKQENKRLDKVLEAQARRLGIGT